MRRIVRTFQTNFPFLREAQAEGKRLLQRFSRIPFEADFKALALIPIPREALFLDVGANRGLSAEAFLMYAPSARIYLFEPNPVVSKRLLRRYESSPRMEVFECGLGDRTEERILYVPFYKGWMFDALASFDRKEASEWLETRIAGYRRENLRIEEYLCAIKRIDDMGIAPFFIKLDVQGHELAVLRGAEQTLRTHRPIILLESLSPVAQAWASGLGYVPYAFRGGRFHAGERGELNTFLLPPEKTALVEAYLA